MGLFEDIGEKLMKCAIIIFAINILACIIGAVVLWINGFILWGFVTLFIGPFFAWLESALLYGFGQLIDNSEIIRIESEKIAKNSNNKSELVSVKTNIINSSEFKKDENTASASTSSNVNYSWESKETGECELCKRPITALYNCYVTDTVGNVYRRKLCNQCRDKTHARPDL